MSRRPVWQYGALAAITITLGLLVSAPAQAAPVPVSAAPTGAAANQDDVIARVVDAKGESITVYSPAPGVSSAKLYATLKARGVPGLIDPATQVGVSPMEVGECSMRGAHAYYNRCGSNRYHWAGTHPTVFFVDHSGAGWPVASAVTTWNQSTAINAIYLSGSSSCTGNCVDVYNGPYGTDLSWVAQTTLHWFNSDPTVIVSAEILFNDSNITPGDTHWHLETSCHETGHALGLGHHDFETSCMYAGHTAARSNKPQQGDWEMLDSIY